MNPHHRLWEYRPVRDLGLLIGLGWLLYLVYHVRVVTLPVLIGLGGAYAVNPLVSWAQLRFGVARWLSTAALLISILAAAGGLMVYVLPKLIGQLTSLIQNLPDYLRPISFKLGIDWEQLARYTHLSDTGPADAPEGLGVQGLAASLDLQAVLSLAARSLGAGLGLVGSLIGTVGYLGLVVVVAGFCFFYFSWHFENILGWVWGWGQTLISPPRRARTARIIRRMDTAISAFLRGRIIQAVIMATVLCVGWWLAGVPYWLLLGLGSGLLNLIPYAASLGWLTAVLLTGLDLVSGGASFDIWHVMIWPSLVYGFAQGLDGWVIEPTVQGRATELDPLTVMLAVLVGGSLAGMMGLILAIPVTACGKILAQEVILPRLRTDPTTPD